MRLVRNTLAGVAVLLLGYCGFVLADSWVFQYRQGREFERSLRAPASAAAGAPPANSGGIWGRIEVPRLGVSVLVAEGTGSGVLRRAAGHIAGTALPGQAGNVGISAHRDTFFRPLRNIRANDRITVTTLGGIYEYRVVSTKIVDPSDVGVLNSSGGETLTLVTCYPFYFIGPAPSRFIVRAERAREPR
jgi:sortase A